MKNYSEKAVELKKKVVKALNKKKKGTKKPIPKTTLSIRG